MQINYALLAEASDVLKAWGVDMIWGTPIYLVDPSGQVVAESFSSIEKRLEKNLGKPR